MSTIKPIAFTLLTCFVLSAGAQQKKASNLTLTIDISRLSFPVEKLYFSYYNTISKERYMDSAVIGKQKVITFRTSITEPILSHLRVLPANDKQNYNSSRYSYTVYLEPGKITATAKDPFNNMDVTGSASHKDYVALKTKAAAYDQPFEHLYAQYKKARNEKNVQVTTAISKRIDSLEQVRDENVYKDFVKKNGQRSAVALYALSEYAGHVINPKKVKPVYDLLGPSIKSLPTGIAFDKRLALAKKLQIGQRALAFTQPDTLGKPISLASFKGKYVLIDFWASWCGPCRAENPNVVAAYNKYREKDFTVLGISLDKPGQKEKWLKAIHDDKLRWTHVSDLKFWDNEVAKLYDIKSIPQNYLLDREGRIVAKNIRGEDLHVTLQSLLK